mmetsp:Transcript_61276/g.84151  ORF Transcript_61276/g.84151 Transcript_61276/m.84151 type:complete len:179 (-) Transcript_61276:382-918(-)
MVLSGSFGCGVCGPLDTSESRGRPCFAIGAKRIGGRSSYHGCDGGVTSGSLMCTTVRRRLVVLRANPFLAVDWEVMLDDILLLNLGHDLISMEIIHLPARPSPKPNTGFALSSSLVKGRGRSFNEYRASDTLGQGLSTKTNVLYMADERVSIQLYQVLLKLVPSLRTPVLDQLFTPQS